MTKADRPLRLGTRASPLALAQAELVEAALLAAHPGLEVEIVAVTATGDRIQDRALAEVGGKALWTKELDEWLASGEIDFAVHSMKDVETVRPPEFNLAAMLKRGDVRDRLIGADSIDALPHGAKLGTSSPRRTAQLLALRPDLEIVLFRGNVQTRLQKLTHNVADATLLAAAGLDRLDMADVGAAVQVEKLLPAPSQGAIGIECRADDAAVTALLTAIDHRETHLCVAVERALLAALNADCRSPVAALAVIEGDQIWLRAEILAMNGSEVQAGALRFAPGEADAPARLARDLLERVSPGLRGLFG